MPAGAASSCALPWTLVSRPVSRQSRPQTLVFPGKTCGFVVEVQDSNKGSSNCIGLQLCGCRLRRCISRRTPEIESLFESRKSVKRGGKQSVNASEHFDNLHALMPFSPVQDKCLRDLGSHEVSHHTDKFLANRLSDSQKDRKTVKISTDIKMDNSEIRSQTDVLPHSY